MVDQLVVWRVVLWAALSVGEMVAYWVGWSAVVMVAHLAVSMAASKVASSVAVKAVRKVV
jgi:hypothetical protein